MVNQSKLTLALPVLEKKRLVQAEINTDLLAAVEREAKKSKYRMRQVMEWGMKAFLLQANPKVAADLGIVGQGE